MDKLSQIKIFILGALIAVGLCAQTISVRAAETETITLAGGCFWCVEADFEKVNGVKEAVSGFTGGKVRNPTYKQVVAGGTGHYEAVQIVFDPSIVSRDTILSLFFRSIDPLDAGGQFCDRGPTYRSAIFATPDQKAAAQSAKSAAEAELGQKVVTSILNSTTFYPADDYHQDYYKSSDRLALTSVGVGVKKSVAYKRYRDRCGRDQRVKRIWGTAAPFAG